MLGSMRALAILAFAAAAVLVGIGKSSGHRFLVAIGAALFLLGVAAFFRWRGRVLDYKEKTPPEDP
jgi:predicted phage tail protein